MNNNDVFVTNTMQRYYVLCPQTNIFRVFLYYSHFLLIYIKQIAQRNLSYIFH